jgi:23S rRNA (uracil1939-C5)-methyltransferase
VIPYCRHFGPCGGCDWQNLSYDEQLARKHRRLTELLESTLGSRAPAVEPMIGMAPDSTGWPWRFRRKASFVFGQDPQTRALVIGHYAAASRSVVPIIECPVHTDRANRIAFALHATLARARISAAGPSLTGVLRHLIVRTTQEDREAVAMLVVTRNAKSLRKPIRAVLESAERPTGFFLNIHDRPGPYMVGRETIRLEGRSHVRENLAGLGFLLSPTAFFQTNVDAAAVILDQVLACAPAGTPLRVLDLYAGSGLFALPLAARGHAVTAIEENEQAVDDAFTNIRLNHLQEANIQFVQGRVEKMLAQAARHRVDLAVLDPPRDGCPPRVLNQVFADIRPRTAIYVSCAPEALASELPDILASGYYVDRVQPVDMFPHTTHIETVVTLSRQRRSVKLRKND